MNPIFYLIFGLAFLCNFSLCEGNTNKIDTPYERLIHEALDAGNIEIFDKSLETNEERVQVWIITKDEHVTGFILNKNKEKYKGVRIDFQPSNNSVIKVVKLAPKTTWGSLWEKLKSYGLFDLSSQGDLSKPSIIFEGYDVVIKEFYNKISRVAHYRGPFRKGDMEGQKVVKILNLLGDMQLEPSSIY